MSLLSVALHHGVLGPLSIQHKNTVITVGGEQGFADILLVVRPVGIDMDAVFVGRVPVSVAGDVAFGGRDAIFQNAGRIEAGLLDILAIQASGNAEQVPIAAITPTINSVATANARRRVMALC
jgi:hypothetical protein